MWGSLRRKYSEVTLSAKRREGMDLVAGVFLRIPCGESPQRNRLLKAEGYQRGRMNLFARCVRGP